MKLTRTIATVTAFLLLQLLSASAWAKQPTPGTYIKQDDAGRTTAYMYITANKGKGVMAVAANDISISMEAVDVKEYATEQMVTDYVENTAGTGGMGLEGFRLTGDNLRHSLTAAPDHPRFSPERFSVAWGKHVEYALPEPGRITVRGCGENLDGTYVYDENMECITPLPALLFAYEKTYCRAQYNNQNAPSGWYALERTADSPAYPRGEHYALQVNNPPKDDFWNLFADSRMNIVMDTRYTDFHFLFVANSYKDGWTETAWRDFAGSDQHDVNALFLHQYITRNAPELLENPNTFFRLDNMYKGKHDSVNWELTILRPENDGATKLGTALIDNTGHIELIQGDAPVDIKKFSKKTKKK